MSDETLVPCLFCTKPVNEYIDSCAYVVVAIKPNSHQHGWIRAGIACGDCCQKRETIIKYEDSIPAEVQTAMDKLGHKRI